ncbi:Alpha/beta hydrolase fold protein [Cupriavidus necator]|uniref:Alpha/beta hydrolase fold protein n=1 Tax=Cupriavidus necator TaxID=106590 RepID=A0A1K0IV12_CUPNE|nr:Alpha/beta hydrolase fold protein [Cupriavidus necator]
MTRTSGAGDQPGTDDLLGRLEAMAVVHRVRCGNVRMVWRQFGQGSPLVLLHGGHGGWMHWIRNIEALGRQHTLWLPDMPGFGDSGTLGGDPYAADRFERLTAAIAGGLDSVLGPGSPFGLAGFSFGGLAAASLAARLPNVERLALLGCAGHGGPRRQAAELVDWRSDDRGRMRAALRHNLGALMLHDQASIDALALDLHEHMCKATRFHSKALSRRPLLGEALSAFHGPTLLLWGEHDVTAQPCEAAQRLAGGALHRDWCLVPGAGHWVQYERPQEVNQLLLRWFSSPITPRSGLS